jgi:hypothetical protein
MRNVAPDADSDHPQSGVEPVDNKWNGGDGKNTSEDK